MEQLAEDMILPEQGEADDETADAPDLDEDQTEEVDASEEPEDETGLEPEQDESEDNDAVPEQPQSYTVKVDGQDVTVTLEELQRSYSGQQYIQKGMKEAAEARKKAEAEFQEFQQHQQRLQDLVQFASNGGFVPPTPPDIKKLQEDPIGYMEEKAIFEQRAAEYNQAVQQFQQNQQLVSQREQEAQQAYLAEQKDILLREIPDFGDPEKGPALQRKIVDAGVNQYGLTADEINGIADARQIRVLRDAMRYHELLEATKKAAAKTAKARPVAKPGAKTDQKRGTTRKMRERLKAEGSMDAAMALMLSDDQ